MCGEETRPTGIWTTEFYENSVPDIIKEFKLLPEVAPENLAPFDASYDQSTKNWPFGDVCTTGTKEMDCRDCGSGCYHAAWKDMSCFVNCLIYSMNNHGANISTEQVNLWMMTEPKLWDAEVGFDKNAFFKMIYNYTGIWHGYDKNISNLSPETLKQEICENLGTCIYTRLDFITNRPTHAVFAYGFTEDYSKIKIKDSAGGETTTLDKYNNEYYGFTTVEPLISLPTYWTLGGYTFSPMMEFQILNESRDSIGVEDDGFAFYGNDGTVGNPFYGLETNQAGGNTQYVRGVAREVGTYEQIITVNDPDPMRATIKFPVGDDIPCRTVGEIHEYRITRNGPGNYSLTGSNWGTANVYNLSFPKQLSNTIEVNNILYDDFYVRFLDMNYMTISVYVNGVNKTSNFWDGSSDEGYSYFRLNLNPGTNTLVITGQTTANVPITDTFTYNVTCQNDTDGDRICDAIDNCPHDYNPKQLDADNDGKGDCCDPNNPGCGGCGLVPCDTCQ